MRLFTVLAGLIAGLAALAGAVMAVGRASASSGVVGVLGLDYPVRCGGGPCVLGITPGRTAWAEAQVRLAALDSEADDKQISIDLPAKNGVTFFRSVDRVSVGRVSLNIQREAYTITAGWIIERYGLPCGVSIYWRVGMLTLRYPSLMANISITTRLGPDSPVRSVFYHDPAFDGGRELDPCQDNVSDTGMMHRLWRGFASINAYWRHR